MTSDAMIEAAAQAIFQQDFAGCGGIWKNKSSVQQEDYRKLARAALEAALPSALAAAPITPEGAMQYMIGLLNDYADLAEQSGILDNGEDLAVDLRNAAKMLAAAGESDVTKLRAALDPFTKLGGPDDGVMPAYHDLEDDVVIYKNSGAAITAGDVRKARDVFGLLHAPQKRR